MFFCSGDSKADPPKDWCGFFTKNEGWQEALVFLVFLFLGIEINRNFWVVMEFLNGSAEVSWSFFPTSWAISSPLKVVCLAVPGSHFWICRRQSVALGHLFVRCQVGVVVSDGSGCWSIFQGKAVKFWAEWSPRSGWWFQTFLIFTPIGGRLPFWLICFRWVESTN